MKILPFLYTITLGIIWEIAYALLIIGGGLLIALVVGV
jgi:hypothetical protein